MKNQLGKLFNRDTKKKKNYNYNKNNNNKAG